VYLDVGPESGDGAQVRSEEEPPVPIFLHLGSVRAQTSAISHGMFVSVLRNAGVGVWLPRAAKGLMSKTIVWSLALLDSNKIVLEILLRTSPCPGYL
jgi:hypothetical protein